MSYQFQNDPVEPGLSWSLANLPANPPLPPGLGATLAQGGMPVPQQSGPTQTAQSPADPADPDYLHQVRTIYGETSGVYPQLLPGKSGLYHPQNWDPASADQLQTARAWIAGVRLRNPVVHEASADTSNGVESMAWKHANDAAQQAQTMQLPQGVNHFYIREEGAPDQDPNWGKPYKSFGPFINVGGNKNTPAGAKTFIDFYRGTNGGETDDP